MNGYKIPVAHVCNLKLKEKHTKAWESLVEGNSPMHYSAAQTSRRGNPI